MQLDTYYFTTASGRNLVKEFIQQQDELTQSKLIEKIRQLEKFGFQLPKSDLTKLAGTKELWELRIKSGGNIYRLFVAQCGISQAILLHAIQKKSQKTPQRDLQTALTRLLILKQQGVL
jgi:phage-related protein